MFISYHNILLEVYFTHTQLHTETHLHTHTRTHVQITTIIFFWNFGIVPATQTSTSVFITFLTKPLFAQNVPGLTLVLCIVFIADFFPWLHVERFQSTEVRQFCLRLRIMRKTMEIVISHVAYAV